MHILFESFPHFTDTQVSQTNDTDKERQSRAKGELEGNCILKHLVNFCFGIDKIGISSGPHASSNISSFGNFNNGGFGTPSSGVFGGVSNGGFGAASSGGFGTASSSGFGADSTGITFHNPVPTPRHELRENDIDLIVNLIKANSGLRSVQVDMLSSGMKAMFTTLCASIVPKLETLVLHRSAFGFHQQVILHPHAAQRFLHDLPVTLRHFDFNINVDYTTDFTMPSASAATPYEEIIPCREHPRLESLQIKGIPTHSCEAVLLQFLQRCGPTLKQVNTPNWEHLTIDSLFKACIHGLVLDTLEIEEYQDISTRDLDKIVARSSAWKIIIIRDCNCENAVASAIAEHCQELEELDIACCERISSAAIQKILCNAVKLQRFHASEIIDEGIPTNSQLQASDVIPSFWVCTGLKVFQADIVGIPRPDVMANDDNQPVPVRGPLDSLLVQESHDLQRRVLAQLGRLTELEELILGSYAMDIGDETLFVEQEDGEFDYGHPDLQMTCLEMSLASGLELLSGLKNLRVLDLSKMLHRVGPDELKWMRENWPKLERIEGLEDQYFKPLVAIERNPFHFQWHM
ncbi:hypothetical protein BGZ94_005038 [Podila epigama]|nr:hypothetical protein BGZ94_005038 [Podila epigama]